jgi:hypothetical protein
MWGKISCLYLSFFGTYWEGGQLSCAWRHQNLAEREGGKEADLSEAVKLFSMQSQGRLCFPIGCKLLDLIYLYFFNCMFLRANASFVMFS